MATGPDLFVVCKNCGAEVSPYITECPYCGTRLRKRAPKIERDGTISEPRSRRRRASRPRRERRLPGVGSPAYGARPWATIVLVGLSLALWVALVWIADFRVVPVSFAVAPQRILYGVFAYFNGWYELAALGAVGLYGWLLERRHGPLPVVLLFLAGGVGGLAVAVAAGDVPALGANGAALALLCAWALRDGLAARRGEDYDGDLLGTAVFSAVVFLMPAFVVQASWVAGGVGIVVGALGGLLLARVPES